MQEKYFYIEKEVARQLLNRVSRMHYAKRGFDRRAYLLDDYVVLSTNRLKLRNVDTRYDDFAYFDEIIETLANMHACGIAVVPILGYCYDPHSSDGEGFIIQQRAKGEELYDDAILTKFTVWAQNKNQEVYLSTDLSDAEAADYLYSRTHAIAQAPQIHFDRFVHDMIRILEANILVDFNGSSNFFYDQSAGFQFIDLDAHNDYRYGLSSTKPCIEEIVSLCGFVACHYAEDTELFAHVALANNTLDALTPETLKMLKAENQIVFEKSKSAMRSNGIPENMLNQALSKLKIFGC